MADTTTTNLSSSLGNATESIGHITQSISSLTSRVGQSLNTIDNVTFNSITATGIVTASEVSSSGGFIGETSANTAVLQTDLTTILNNSEEFGTVESGETFSAGTSIESILRQILISYIKPTFSANTFKMQNASSTDMFTRREVGNKFTLTKGEVTTGSDSSNDPFSNESLSLTGNQNDSGIGSNVITGFAFNGNGTNCIDIDTKTIQRIEPGEVKFTLTGTPAQGTDVTTSDTTDFYFPLFVGGSSQTGTLDSTLLDAILGDISGSISIDSGTTFDFTESPFVAQTYLGSSTSATQTNFTNITFNAPSSALTSGNFLYIVYPAYYGLLTKCDLVNVGDLLADSTMLNLGVTSHNRFHNIVYRVYRSRLTTPITSTQQITISS